MLVRGRVEDAVRLILVHDAEYAVIVADRADDRHEIQVRIEMPELLLDGVGIVLVDIKNDKAFRPGLCDLTAELGPDGAASARHKDAFSVKRAEDLVVVDPDFLAPEEVRHLDVAQLRDVDVSLDQLVDAGKDLHLCACRPAEVEHFASYLR